MSFQAQPAADTNILPSTTIELAANARVWVGVVSKTHVSRGYAGGFAQVCHGKAAPLRRMKKGDVLVYYSPKSEMGGGEVIRSFTAIGTVVDHDVYQFDMGGGFIPYRRNIRYYPTTQDALISKISHQLRFIQDNPNWGMLARRGHFEICLSDLRVIAEQMGVQTILQRAVGKSICWGYNNAWQTE